MRDTFFANNFDVASTTDSLIRIFGKPRKTEEVASAPSTIKEGMTFTHSNAHV